MSPQGSWRPGSKQEIALVNLVPGSLTGKCFEMPCRLSSIQIRIKEINHISAFLQ
jgi:hypothetical protein